MKCIYQKLFLSYFLLQGFVFAHCQVPCGIYNDAVRIIQIREDFSTIQKAFESPLSAFQRFLNYRKRTHMKRVMVILSWRPKRIQNFECIHNLK